MNNIEFEYFPCRDGFKPTLNTLSADCLDDSGLRIPNEGVTTN